MQVTSAEKIVKWSHKSFLAECTTFKKYVHTQMSQLCKGHFEEVGLLIVTFFVPEQTLIAQKEEMKKLMMI